MLLDLASIVWGHVERRAVGGRVHLPQLPVPVEVFQRVGYVRPAEAALVARCRVITPLRGAARAIAELAGRWLFVRPAPMARMGRAIHVEATASGQASFVPRSQRARLVDDELLLIGEL